LDKYIIYAELNMICEDSYLSISERYRCLLMEEENIYNKL
jgi:hypothetical protein